MAAHTLRSKSPKLATPTRHNGRGTFRLAKTFPTRDGGTVRFAKASGTEDEPTWRNMNVMLAQLCDNRQYDALERLDSGEWSPTFTYDAWKTGKLRELTTPKTEALEDSMRAWLKESDVKHNTRSDYNKAIGRIVKASKVLKKKRGMTAEDLPAILMAYRETCKIAGTARSFNLTRAAALTYLNRPGGESEELWLKTKHRVRVLKGGNKNPRLAREYADVCKVMGDFSEERLYAFWFAAHTGLNYIDIFDGEWQILEDRVHVTTGKNEHRENRFIPLLFVPEMIGLHVGYRHAPDDNNPFYSTQECTEALKVRQRDWQLAEARACFAHWLELAKVPDSRCLAYQGHAVTSKRQLERYRRHEVVPFLVPDAQQVRLWMDSELAEAERKLKQEISELEEQRNSAE